MERSDLLIYIFDPFLNVLPMTRHLIFTKYCPRYQVHYFVHRLQFHILFNPKSFLGEITKFNEKIINLNFQNGPCCK